MRLPIDPADVLVETYKGREIVYPRDNSKRKIFVAGRPVVWGELRGTFYLDVYAYDRGKTLEETVRKYIDYLDKIRSKHSKEEA